MTVRNLVSGLAAAAALAVPLLAWQATPLSVCCMPSDNDMPVAGGNLGNQRYSTLAAINLQNIGTLGPAWRTRVSAVPLATNHVGTQTTPVVVDGVIFLNTPAGGVIAVDGATGASRWKWQPTEVEVAGGRGRGAAPGGRGAAPGGRGAAPDGRGGAPGGRGAAAAEEEPPATITGVNRRGVSVGDGKVFAIATGSRIAALDQATGAEVWVVQVTAADGSPVGGLGEVATLYHDGLVYVATGGGENSVIAVRSSDGSTAWTFDGIAQPGRVVTDVNGRTIDAGATWSDCEQRGGGGSWTHGAIDPTVGMVYYTFSNARGCGGSQDSSGRQGENLFANAVVALDMKTGDYQWHYQAVHQDIWDMDNVHPPLLADLVFDGRMRQAIYYGSKSGHLFVLDRTNGQPILRAEEVPMTQDSRQASYATQPMPNRPLPTCLVWQALDPDNIPGDPWRAVPNYNGYQPDASGQLVYTEPNYLDEDKPFVEYPSGMTHREGCLYDTHWDQPVLSTTSQNGGPTFGMYSLSHKLGLIYFPYAVSPVAHWRGAGGNGQRATGQYQSGGILAIDAATNTVRWTSPRPTDMGHNQSPLSTAGDLVFVGMVDGNFLALNAATGEELWRFQTGAAISGAPITYMIDGEQYIALLAAGGGIPYGNALTRSDSLWAFKLGGTYRTESGSSEAPTPAPVPLRRDVGGQPVEGREVDNTIYLARNSRTSDTAEDADRVNANAMSPTILRVPVGTTVTFLNPGAETFPNFPNQKLHCATQYFEGLFNPRLQPGERFEYTFDRAGEYFFNDCTDPRPTGKVVAYHTPEDVPGAVTFENDTLDFTSPTGVFTGVQGVVTARVVLPAGNTFEGDAMLETPLSDMLIPAIAARMQPDGRTVLVDFNKADIDNNVPAGASVPLVFSAHVRRDGAQRAITSTATVTVVK